MMFVQFKGLTGERSGATGGVDLNVLETRADGVGDVLERGQLGATAGPQGKVQTRRGSSCSCL